MSEKSQRELAAAALQAELNAVIGDYNRVQGTLSSLRRDEQGTNEENRLKTMIAHYQAEIDRLNRELIKL